MILTRFCGVFLIDPNLTAVASILLAEYFCFCAMSQTRPRVDGGEDTKIPAEKGGPPGGAEGAAVAAGGDYGAEGAVGAAFKYSSRTLW